MRQDGSRTPPAPRALDERAPFSWKTLGMDDFFEFLFSWATEILFGAFVLSVLCGVWTHWRRLYQRRKAFELLGLSQKHLVLEKRTKSSWEKNPPG